MNKKQIIDAVFRLLNKDLKTLQEDGLNLHEAIEYLIRKYKRQLAKPMQTQQI